MLIVGDFCPELGLDPAPPLGRVDGLFKLSGDISFAGSWRAANSPLGLLALGETGPGDWLEPENATNT